jgi:pimeloyl-ACP methyl ester carboxylesterase
VPRPDTTDHPPRHLEAQLIRFRRIAAVVAFVVLACASSAQPDVMADAPSRWAKGPTGRIHYKSWGRGKEALVFIHGWSCDMSYFAEQIPHFADRMRVIAIDLPGHGASDKPEVEYTQTLFAESVRRVLDDARVRRAVLVGHSMGMPVARQFCRLYPERTAGIVSLDGSVKAMITDQKTIDTIMTNLRGPGYKATATYMIEGMLAKAPDTPYKTHIREVMLATPQHVVASAASGMFDISLWNDDPISVPVLLIHARNPLWNEDYETYAHKIIPKLDYVVLDGVSHFLHTEKPAEVNALIDAFLVKNQLLGQR